MKKKMMVIMCSLLLAMPVLSFAKEKKAPDPSASAYEHANENARFERNQALFNYKVNKRNRAAKRLAEKEVAAAKKKEAAEAKKKAEEAQDKGEGQVKLRF